MQHTSYIVSLKYSPGLAQYFRLLGENLARRQWRSEYLISSSYQWLFGGSETEAHYLTGGVSVRETLNDLGRLRWRIAAPPRRLFNQYPPDLLLFYNSHPANYTLANLAVKANPGGIRAVYLHEPFVPDKSSYGRIRAAYISLNEWLQTRTLRLLNHVVVPSPHARHLFERRYPEYDGEIHLAPLLMTDRRVSEPRPRRYVSLVGNLNQSRGLEEFIALVNYAASHACSWEFKLVTRSSIEHGLRALSTQGRALLTVRNDQHISDAEIAETVAESFAMFLPHKQATQSGNVPVCFMQGTPIIARDIPGLAQHVHHGHNGYLLPVNFTVSDLAEAAQFIRDNFQQLSLNARRDYEDIFDERNWPKYYSWLWPDSQFESVRGENHGLESE